MNWANSESQPRVLLYNKPPINNRKEAVTKVIAALNFKGGVGKTTITWLLARYVAHTVGKNITLLENH